MNRIRMALVGLMLALGLVSAPLAHSALAAHKGGAKLAPRAGGPRTSTPRTHGIPAYVASVLGVTPAVLQADLKAGQTLLQIAGSKYANADALATALLAPLKSKLATAIGRTGLSATQANALYTKAHARVAQLVVTPHPALGALLAGIHGPNAQHAAHGKAGLLATLTAACNTNATALKAAVTTGGKTLLAICQATNPSVTQSSLVSALLAPTQTRLNQAVAAKTITAAQASTMLTKVQAHLTTLITTTIPAGGLHGFK